FEAYGDATLALEWSGPDSEGRREVIQGDALNHVIYDDTGTGSGDPDYGDGKDQGSGGDDTSGGDTGTGEPDHGDGMDNGSGGDDTSGGDTGTGDHDHGDGSDHGSGGDDTSGGDTGTGEPDHGDGSDHGSGGDDTSGGDTGMGDHDHGSGGDDTSGGDTGTGAPDHGDGSDHGSGDHDSHSGGHVPPPTSPAEVDDYVAAVMAQPESHAHGDDASLANEHMAVLDLVPRSEATHVAVRDGDWFDPNTWHEGRIPDAGAQVVIPESISVLYSGQSDASLFTVRVDGELSFAHNANSKMLVDTMVVSPTGRLEIGTEENPIGANYDVEIVIANNGDIDTSWDPMLLSRGVISHGEVEIHGAEKTSFLAVSDAPMRGDTQINLSEIPEGWQVGDTIVLTGTHKEGWYWDNDAGVMRRHDSQDEEVVITAINGNVITLDRALEYDHDTPRDDLAAYVANTSRNVTFSSEDGEDTAVHHRGHTMFMHSDDVDVRYAAFDDLGRTDKSVPAFSVTSLDSVQSDSNIQSRYPFHFHRTGTEDQENPAIAIGNSVTGSPGWGYAHHDSHAIFTDNVAFDIFGAAFVAEDGNETGVWSHNIAIDVVGVGYTDAAVKDGPAVERHDNGRTGEGFFFAGRLVEASDNVAANTTHGYVWMTRQHPRDPLSDNLDQPEIAYGSDSIRLDVPPIQGFHNNEAFGTEVGLIVIKANPNQDHDVRSVMDGFLNWETWEGVNLSYTSHYTLIDFDILATQNEELLFGSVGFNLGGNAFDVVVNGMRVEGFRTGVDLDQEFHFGTDGADYDDVFIDLVLVDNDNNFVGFNSSRHSVISSDDLVEGRLGFVLESDTVLSEGESLFLRGLKTDSIGSRDREFAGDRQILDWHEDIAAIIANDGYYKTESGQNVVLIEDFVADRATGQLMKMAHVITLDMTDAEIANSWSINHWGGAQYNGIISFDNVAPTARDDLASTSAGNAVLIDVLSNDSHVGGDDIRVDGLSTTPNGNVYLQDDGQLLYVPNPDFTGIDSFDYWAADEDGDFSQATVTVEVFDL
ncbi:G8 domain-containing protein, partial [Ruegeria arenilitoris]|uniref:G8 domain-containing protein n=1 Tax=Ruegeria arenilitoris TaxID=1173585 RepID=UPI00147DBD5A